MKRVLICLLALLTLTMVCACGKEQKNNISNSGNNLIEENQESCNDSTVEDIAVGEDQSITIEELKSAKETAVSDFEYEKVEDGMSITRYIGRDKVVVIPENIDGEKVVIIGEAAFANNETLQAVRISDSVKLIEEQAFGHCTALKILICGDALETLDKHAFNYCISLSTVELNEGLVNMNRLCFGGSTFKEISIPSSVQYMDFPFYGSFEEKTVVIVESGSYAETYAEEFGENHGWDVRVK